MSFVRSGKSETVGEDAVKVTRVEAITMQWQIISNWKPSKDVVSMVYGPAVLGALTAFSGYMFCSMYRNKLALRQFGVLSTYTPTVMVPGMLSPVFHRMFVTSDIIVDGKCLVCTQVKAAMLQNVIGIIQPLFVAPVGCYMIANLKHTVRIPSLVGDWKSLLKFHMKISKPFYSQTLPWLFGANTLIPMLLTYLEYKEMFTVCEKLQKIEKIGDELKL